MRFAFSDDQLALRDAVRDLLRKGAAPDRLRAVWDGPLGWDPGLWSQLAEMGVLGLLAPESAGGLGPSGSRPWPTPRPISPCRRMPAMLRRRRCSACRRQRSRQ